MTIHPAYRMAKTHKMSDMCVFSTCGIHLRVCVFAMFVIHHMYKMYDTHSERTHTQSTQNTDDHTLWGKGGREGESIKADRQSEMNKSR